MQPQSYENHIRFYPPHHFVFYPVLSILLGLCIYFTSTASDPMPYILMSILFACLIWLSFMMRQHYALTLQNRIIRLEISYRYFTLTGKRIEVIEDELRDSQLFALRFASDEEFLSLLERALKEKISGTKIKKAIRNWKPDHQRV